MADIRISALPNEPAPNAADFVPIDLASTRKTTVQLLTEAGRPAASQAEAEAGVQASHVMTPLTTKQAITFYGPTLFQPLSTKLTNFDGTSLSAGALIFASGVNTFTVLPAGSPNQFLQNVAGNPTWTNASGSGDVVGPASAVSGSVPTYNGTTGKVIQAGNPLLADMLLCSRGSLPTISNSAGDLTNDIDFSAGYAFSSDASNWPMIGAALTKQLDVAWAAGNNAGGRMSAAAIANTTYHCFQIRRPDTGVVDYGFDVSATAPTLPTNYTQYRRIGSILRESAAIVLFDQGGDNFVRRTNATTRSNTAAAAAALLTFQVPLGINCQPIVTGILVASASVSCSMSLGSASAGNVSQQICSINTGVSGQADSLNQPPPVYTTNTSAQLYFSQVNGVGTPASSTLVTAGWVDTRGR